MKTNESSAMPAAPGEKVNKPQEEAKNSQEENNKPSQEDKSSESVNPPVLAEKPEIIDPAKQVSNNIKTPEPVALNHGIEVIAMQKGFFNQQRIPLGQKFVIKNEKQFGKWFRCLDPVWEKKRLAHYDSRKAKK